MSQPNLLELEAPIKICGEQASGRVKAALLLQVAAGHASQCHARISTRATASPNR